MRKLFLAAIAAIALFTTTPVYAECGSGQVTYLRSSQREFRGLDFRLKVTVQTPAQITVESPVIDVATTFVNPYDNVSYSGGNTIYSFQLAPDGIGSWSYSDGSSTAYSKVSLRDNFDGTATIRVAMRVPYTVSSGGLGYFATLRACD